MHVVDEALEPQGLRRRGLGVDAREEEPGTSVDVAELGFAGVDERPQVRDGHVGTQERRLVSSAVARVVLLGKPCGEETVDAFRAAHIRSEGVEGAWVHAFQGDGSSSGR